MILPTSTVRVWALPAELPYIFQEKYADSFCAREGCGSSTGWGPAWSARRAAGAAVPVAQAWGWHRS